jgi:hypothetical protein
MEPVTHTRDAYHEALADHEELCRAADRLRLVALAPADALPPNRLQGLLSHDLRAFADRVRLRFRASESERGPGRQPEAQALLARIESEHGPLRARLEALCREPAGPELRDSLIALLDDLAAHDCAETQALQEAVLRDTGTGD